MATHHNKPCERCGSEPGHDGACWRDGVNVCTHARPPLPGPVDPPRPPGWDKAVA